MIIKILNNNMSLIPTLVSEQNILVYFVSYEYVLKLKCSLTIELCYRDTYLISNEIQIWLAFEKFQTNFRDSEVYITIE